MRIARPRAFSQVTLLILILVVAITCLPAKADVAGEETQLLQLTNQERTARTTGTLTMNSLLYKVAKDYSKEMMENGFFSHVSKVDGSTLWDRISRSGYYDNYGGPTVIRENIALISGSASASTVHRGFMNSEGHRDNLLASDVNEAGIGMTEGTFQSVFVTIYVEVFAYHSRDQTSTLLGTVSPDSMTVQRGQTAVFRIHVESYSPAWVYVQVTNIASTLVWRIDKPAGITPHDALLTIDTTSASSGTYVFGVAAMTGSQTKTILSTLIILPSAQTTTQTTVSTTSTTTRGTSITTSISVSSTQLSSTTTTSEKHTSLTSSTSSVTTTSLQTSSITTTSTSTTTGSTLIETTTTLTIGSSSQTTTTTIVSSTSSSTSTTTETQTSLRTISLPTIRCVIATAAFGSELSPEVQFLKQFRDEKAMSTFSGKMFMAAFNAAYYSVSPPIANFIAKHSWAASVVRILIHPLVAVLRFTTGFSEYIDGDEASMLSCGLLASMLLGLIYLFPFLFLIHYARRDVQFLRYLFDQSREE